MPLWVTFIVMVVLGGCCGLLPIADEKYQAWIAMAIVISGYTFGIFVGKMM